jgi:hypothetical protein
MAGNYKVVGQRWSTTINAANQFVRVIEITAQTPGGTIFTIDVPQSQYNKTAVDEILTAHANEIVAVENL